MQLRYLIIQKSISFMCVSFAHMKILIVNLPKVTNVLNIIKNKNV